ncbi:MAG: aminotransferase class V-fold PLP-dependent enzyme [Promethearchaeota archaeon]
MVEGFEYLDRVVYKVLETYSNVHRGTGHNSMVTTALFEQARNVILEYFQLEKKEYTVVFCSPLRFRIFKKQLKHLVYYSLSSKDLGLPLGVRVIALKKKDLQKCSVIYTGGGMIKHVTSNYVVWADLPDRFEAGTPNIINVIAFASAVQLVKKFGIEFQEKQVTWRMLSGEILHQDDLGEISGTKLLLELKKSSIGNDIYVPTVKGKKKFINLDNAASTPSFSPIWEVFCKTIRQSKEIHKKIIHDVKAIIANFLSAPLEKYDILFTLNTTEAINILARSLTRLSKKNKNFIIINTKAEHHSNELPFRYIPRAKLIRISIDDNGFIDLDELEKVLRAYNRDHKYGLVRVQIVALSGGSNVLGNCNDLQSISNIVHEYGAKLLVDGAQIVAHHKINISDVNIDYFAFSGHKTYAPFGTGVLLVKKGLLLFNPDEINEIKLSGEENVAGIATLGKAILLLERIGIDIIEDYEKELTRLALNGLNNLEEVKVFGVNSTTPNKFNTRGSIISFNLKSVPHNVAAKELAEYGGIGIRNGCFCAHMLIQHVLKIQQIRVLGARLTSIIFPKRTALCLPGTLRVSFGIENDKTDVECLLNTIQKMIQKPRSIMDKLFGHTNNGTLFVPRTKTEEKMKYYVKYIINKVYSTKNE